MEENKDRKPIDTEEIIRNVNRVRRFEEMDEDSQGDRENEEVEEVIDTNK